MFNVVLFEPEIPPNTGNIIRLCANTGACLHLVEPLGFDLSDRELKRAGLDYHEYAPVRRHASLAECFAALGAVARFAFSTRATTALDSACFGPGAALVFGPESRGLPPAVLADFAWNGVLRIPMQANSRSLNLSNAVAVAIYAAWRQHGYAGAALTARSTPTPPGAD